MRWTAPAATGALIFDCNGTLADTMPTHYQAWLTMLDGYGIAFGEQRFYALAGMPSDRIIELLSQESGVDVTDVTAMVDHKESLYVDSVEAVKRVDVVCEIVLRYRGQLPLAVASGSQRAVVTSTLAAIGLADAFDAVVCSEDTERHKPEPDVFLEAARLMGVAPTSCIVFEDSELGLEAARRAGMGGVDIRPWIGLT